MQNNLKVEFENDLKDEHIEVMAEFLIKQIKKEIEENRIAEEEKIKKQA